MSRIAIIGAGHSGLQLGIGLLADGHQVTVYSDRTPEQIACSRLPSSTGLSPRSLNNERELGIHLWDGLDPVMYTTYFQAGDGLGGSIVKWESPWRAYWQAVDQRLKMPAWMQIFAERGGDLRISPVDVPELDRISAANDLTIIAAGKGEIGALFEIDAKRCTYDSPQRSIGLVALTGMAHNPDGLSYNIAPGVGEALGVPMLTAAGPATAWVLEAVPGGPMDNWDRVTGPDDMVKAAQDIFAQFFPWENDRAAKAEITDPNGYLIGRVTPRVRKPIVTLPSGRRVLGIADVVVLNDPCTGQGANNASFHANLVRRLVAECEGLFDEAWMQRTFDDFWAYAQWPTKFTNTMMAPPQEHMFALLGAAGTTPEIAHRFVQAMTDPSDLDNFFFEPDKAMTFIAEATARKERNAGLDAAAHKALLGV
jgi:hypothetical protein